MLVTKWDTVDDKVRSIRDFGVWTGILTSSMVPGWSSSLNDVRYRSTDYFCRLWSGLFCVLAFVVCWCANEKSFLDLH